MPGRSLRQAVVDDESKRLSTAYGIDEERIRRVITHTVRIVDEGNPNDNPLATLVETDEAPVLFWPSLQRALAQLPTEEVVAAFEEVDMRALCARLQLTRLWAGDGSDLASLQEQKEFCEQLLAFLDHNRETLVLTGYPRSQFRTVPREAKALQYLYYTKIHPSPSGGDFHSWSQLRDLRT